MTAVLEAPVQQGSPGSGWLFIATTAAGIVNYGYALILTHGLAPAAYAAFAAGQALLVVGAAVAGAGVPWVVARELARAPGDRERQAVVVTFGFWANLVIGLVLTVLLAGSVLLFGTARDAAVVGGASLLMSAGSTVLGYLQGVGRMAAIAVLLTAETVAKAGAGAALVFAAHLGSTGALLGFAAGGLVLLTPLPALRGLIRRPAWRGAQADLLRAAVHQTRLQATVAVVAAGDTVLVAVLGLGGTGGGPYQAASALGRVPLFASNAVSTAAFPHLSRDGAAPRKAAALRSYLLVAVLLTGALGTLPDEIRSLVFPATYDAVGQWLPFTAVLGLAIGTLNLGVTFLQADDARGGTVAFMTAVGAGYLALVALAGAACAIAGLAVGAAAASLLAVATLILLPSIRRAAVLLVRSRRNLRDLTGVLLVLLALALAGNPVLWSGIAAVAGVAVLAAAFPEFAPRRRT
jgi:O-antigen/teichoic acid export membrane protein